MPYKMKLIYLIILLNLIQSCTFKISRSTYDNGNSSKTVIFRSKLYRIKSFTHEKVINEKKELYKKFRTAKLLYRMLPEPGRTVEKYYVNGILFTKQKTLLAVNLDMKIRKNKKYYAVNGHKSLWEKSNRDYNGTIGKTHKKEYNESGKLIKNEITIDSLSYNQCHSINF